MRRPAGTFPAVTVSSRSSSPRSNRSSVCSVVVSPHSPPRAWWLQTSFAASPPSPSRDKVYRKESNTIALPLSDVRDALRGHRPSPVPVDTTDAAPERRGGLVVRVDPRERARPGKTGGFDTRVAVHLPGHQHLVVGVQKLHQERGPQAAVFLHERCDHREALRGPGAVFVPTRGRQRGLRQAPGLHSNCRNAGGGRGSPVCANTRNTPA